MSSAKWRPFSLGLNVLTINVVGLLIMKCEASHQPLFDIGHGFPGIVDMCSSITFPESKVYGANTGPIKGRLHKWA